MSDRIKTLLFAAGLCIICSLLLTAASTGLQRFQAQNVIRDKHQNILKSVGLLTGDQRYSTDQIEQLYNDYIKPLWLDESGQLITPEQRQPEDLPIYLYEADGQTQAYIIPINTRGLWGKIHGYLAVANDGATVVGFTVYKHAETPGLGGEIEKQWFQKNWMGKKLVDQQGQFVSINIAKGAVDERIPKAKQENYVDGISGATLTGKYLTAGIREILQNYEPVSIKFRQQRPLQPSG